MAETTVPLEPPTARKWAGKSIICGLGPKKRKPSTVKRAIYGPTCRVYKPNRKHGHNKKIRYRPSSMSPTFKVDSARAIREIKYYQKHSEGLLIAKLPFMRLVKEIADEHRPGGHMRFQASAIACLQEMSEHILVMYFELLSDQCTLALIVGKNLPFMPNVRLSCQGIRRFSVTPSSPSIPAIQSAKRVN